MALSGSFSGSIRSGNYKLRVDWSATQNVAGNTSKITATMYLVIASGWSLNIASRSGNTTAIAGTSYSWSSPAINKGGSTTKLGTVTSGNITHNSDGTKSVTLTATFKIQATISGTYYDTITASTTVTLDTIPRATTPTLSSTSVFMGSSVTISLPRASSSFTHDLAYKFASGSWVTFKTGATTSHAWTVPDLSTSVPNATAGLLSIRCITKNGSTTIGTKTVALTIKVPTSAAYYPTISAVTLTEDTAGLAAQFGAYIQNKSKVKAAITAAGAKGSTIKSISTTFQGGTYSGSSWTSGLLSSSGTLSMTTTVTDSRGRTAKKTTTLSVLAYSTPKITAFDVYRVDEDGNTDTEGARARVYCAYSVPSLNGGNTAAAVAEYKATTDTEWAQLFTEDDLTTNMNWFSGGDIFDVDNQYDVRLTVTDYFGAKSIFQTLLPSGAVIIDILNDGTGVGVGKTAELSGVLDIAMNTRLQGGTRFVEIPVGADLNELRTPGRYVGANVTTYKYTNCPFTSGTFDLDVIAAGSEGQTKQVITECLKDKAVALERFYYGGTWGSWRKISPKAMVTAFTAADITKSALGETQVPLSSASIKADATGLTVSGDAIVVGKHVTNVEVSAQGMIRNASGTSSTAKNLVIKKNGAEYGVSMNSSWSTAQVNYQLNVSPSLFKVKEGDKITLHWYASANDVLSGHATRTYITVKEV